jgi:hypothetical protein
MNREHSRTVRRMVLILVTTITVRYGSKVTTRTERKKLVGLLAG